MELSAANSTERLLMKTVVVGVRLPQLDAEALAQLAQELGTTKSELIRPAVRERLIEVRSLLGEQTSQ